MDISLLRKQLTQAVRGLRQCTISPRSFTQPQSSLDDEIFFEGRKLRRKRIVLLSPGCSVATCTMCPLPNEALHRKYHSVSAEDLIQQFDNAFTTSSQGTYQVVTLYTNGNFFADAEIPPSARVAFYTRIRKSETELFVVESLPQFITARKISEARDHLGDKRLAVSIGLQSVNDLVRELAINTVCTRSAFERSVKILKENNYLPFVFLMLKPPFLTEKEAIDDVLASVRYISTFGIERPTICPTRVAPFTVVHWLFRRGWFKPPMAWSLLAVLKALAQEIPSCKPIIATSLLDQKRNPGSIIPGNCPQCIGQILEIIQKCNSGQPYDPRQEIQCACYREYRKMISEEDMRWGSMPLPARVSQFLVAIQPFRESIRIPA